MQNLNTTKERFEKSRYFNKKYGKLEYVSESGKLFKTNKGQILKFKESFNKDDYDNLPKKYRPEFDIGDEVSLTEDFYDEAEMGEPPEFGWTVEDVRVTDATDGATGDDTYLFEYYIVPSDIGYDDEDDSTGFWVYTSWIKKAGSAKRMGRRFRESTKKFGKKFSKESIDAADPAFVCPYCGGNNCEISIGNDDLNLTYLDRLDGETFNVECWCNDCDKPYDVTVEMKVKDVQPNDYD